MWTINDFPVYGMLSGWSTHGKFACPYCMDDTNAFWLKFGKKNIPGLIVIVGSCRLIIHLEGVKRRLERTQLRSSIRHSYWTENLYGSL